MQSIVFAIAALAGVASLVGASQDVLVLVDDLNTRVSHSKFIHSLSEHGNEVTVELAGSDDIEIKKYGEFLYNSIVLLCPEAKEFGGDLDEDLLLEFVDSGNSLVIAGSPSVGQAVRGVASECGVEFDQAGSMVADHVNFDVADPDGTHSLVVADSFSSSKILGSTKHTPVLFHGIGATVDDTNPLITKLLTGSGTTYSSDASKPIASSPLSAGKGTVLVAAMQTLGRGRVLVSGSMFLFSDAAFASSISKHNPAGNPTPGGEAGNSKFVREVVGWAMHERGVLRAHSLFHRKADGSELMPMKYRVKDQVVFSVVIEEYDGTSGSWKAFTGDDVQLEVRMLDPYIRTSLKPSPNGTFSAELTLPDVYGVFKFVVDYRRDAYSHIVMQQEVGIRPFRHNEFERFIPSAYPYYASAFSMMAGFLVLSVVFLFTKDKHQS